MYANSPRRPETPRAAVSWLIASAARLSHQNGQDRRELLCEVGRQFAVVTDRYADLALVLDETHINPGVLVGVVPATAQEVGATVQGVRVRTGVRVAVLCEAVSLLPVFGVVVDDAPRRASDLVSGDGLHAGVLLYEGPRARVWHVYGTRPVPFPETGL